jgi:predicted metal-dependent hydrolase
VTPVPEEALPPEETVLEAERLMAQGRPFAAHEVFEARWKAAPEDERDLWQGLAQLCVGITHARRGNLVGARRLVERGQGRLRTYTASGGSTYGADVGLWHQRAEEALSLPA